MPLTLPPPVVCTRRPPAQAELGIFARVHRLLTAASSMSRVAPLVPGVRLARFRIFFA